MICNEIFIDYCICFPYLFLLSQQKRKVDAVYYYMRSLLSSNPIMVARENLLTLFDEIRKKVSDSGGGEY